MPDPKDKNNNNSTTNNGAVSFADLIAKDSQSVIKNPLADAPQRDIESIGFNPNDKSFEHIANPTEYSTNNANVQAANQGVGEQMWRATKQFGAGIASGFGQGLANLTDISAWGNDNSVSSLFGIIDTKQMGDWAKKVSENNPIYEKKPGSAFSLFDTGWWTNQLASSGTGIGMGLEALVETGGIEFATGGLGTGEAIARLGQLGSKILKGAKGAETLAEGINIAKNLRSTATVFGVMNRLNESRMEEQQSYQDISETLKAEKNPDGTRKYDDAKINELAKAGANKTWLGNMALLPLDILSYRTMVFNPISGAGEGLIEKGLQSLAEKFGTSTLGKAAGWATTHAVGLASEGAEEGFQYIASEHGKHYAKTLGGINDGDSYVGNDFTANEFWNNVAGGVIGGPIIGGFMGGLNKITSGRRTKYLNNLHSEYVANAGKMTSFYGNKIKEAQEAGNQAQADEWRSQFIINSALDRKHLDAMADKDTAFKSHINFLQTALSEVDAKKGDALADLGLDINNYSDEQITKLKSQLQQGINDSKAISDIYDKAANNYNKNVLPSVVNTKFNIDKYNKRLAQVNIDIATQLAGIDEYKDLSPQGQQLFSIKSELPSLETHREGLNKLLNSTQDEHEKENIRKQIAVIDNSIKDINTKLDTLNNDESYTDNLKENDHDLTESIISHNDYKNAIHEKNQLEAQIGLNRKQLALYNNKEYLAKQDQKVVKNSNSKVAVQEVTDRNKSPEIQETAKETETKIASQEAIKQEQATKVEPKKDESYLDNTPIQKPIIDPKTGYNIGIVPKGNGSDQSFNSDDLFDLPSAVTAGFDALDQAREEKLNEASKENDGLGDLPPIRTLAPRSLGNLDEATVSTLKNTVNTAMNHLGKDASFTDLANLYGKVKGMENLDTNFNKLIKGWEASGREPLTVQQQADIYNSLFNSVETAFDNLDRASFGEIEESSNNLEKAVIENNTNTIPNSTDNNNQSEYDKSTTNTELGNKPVDAKLAFTNTLGKWKLVSQSDGTKKIEFIKSSNEKVFGQYIDSTQLLDPDKYQQGTKLVSKIPDNFRDIIVPIFDNTTGEKINSIPFGQWVSENNIEEGSQEWNAKVPMIIYDNPNSTKGVAFVHDLDWYNIFNNNVPTSQSIQGRESTRILREAILKNKNTHTDLIVSYKTETTIEDLRIPNGGTIPISEANPQTVFVKAGANGALTLDGKTPAFINDIMITSDAPQQGQYYGVIRYGNQEGKKTYLLQKMFPNKVGDDSKVTDTLKYFGCLLVGFSRPNFKNTIKEIYNVTGIDINNQAGVTKFLKQFVPIQSVDGANKTAVENVNIIKTQINDGRNNLKNGDRYVAVTAAGQVVFGTKNADAKMIKSFDDAVEFSEFVKGLDHNIGDANIRDGNANSKTQTVFLSTKDGGNIDVSPQGNYNDYIKTKFNTNLKSINIGTQEKPNYVSQLQPSIGIRLVNEIREFVQPVTVENTVKEINIPIVSNIETLEVNEVKTNNDEINSLLNDSIDLMGGIILDDDTLLSPNSLSLEERTAVLKSIDGIAGLEPNEKSKVTNFIYQQIVEQVQNNTLTGDDLKRNVLSIFDKIFSDLQNKSQAQASKIDLFLSNAESKIPQEDRSKLEKTLTGLNLQITKLKAVNDSFDIFYKEVQDTILKNKYIIGSPINKNIEDDDTSDENPDYSDDSEDNRSVQDFWTDSLRVNPDLRVTPKLRMMLEGIKNVDDKGNETKTIFGLPDYVNSSNILRFLQISLVNVPSTYKDMIAHLESIKDTRPWVKNVIDKLNASDKQGKNSFVRAMSSNPLKPMFSMVTLNTKTKKFSLKLMDSYLSGVENIILKDWKNTFSTKTGIVEYKDEKYNLNQEKLNKTINDIKELKNLDNSVVSLKKVQSVLATIGINLNEKTLTKIKDDGLRANYQTLRWEQLFTDPQGLFVIIEKELRNTNTTDIKEGKTPLDNTIFKALAKVDSNYSDSHTAINFRDNGKSFFGLITPKYISDLAVDLAKESSSTRKTLLSKPFHQQSLLLKLLDKSAKFREQHNIRNVGDMSIKQQGKTNYADSSLSAVSELDHEAIKITGLADMQQGNIEEKYEGTNIGLKLVSMFVPTMSDKAMGMWAKTVGLQLNQFNLDEGNGFNDDLRDVLYQQLVKPDLLRMLNETGKNSGIEGYEKGKSLFLSLASMNKIMFNEDISLADHIKYSGNLKGLKIEDIEGNKPLMDKIYAELKAIILEKRDAKIQEWKSMGLLSLDLKTNQYNTNKFANYVEQFEKGTTKENAVKMAAMDFTIQYMVHNSNMQMAYTGDPALYYKSKSSDPIQQNIDTYDNMNKRLALLIAPAIPYPDGQNEKFLQVFLKDKTSLPDEKFLKFITKIHGKEITNEEIKKLQTGSKDDIKMLSKKFPVASAFFNIEGTDAQEYTTWKEHLNVLERYGSISDMAAQVTQAEIDAARQLFTEGTHRDKLTTGQLELISKVIQPIKPRYVGTYNQDGVQRMMYIKTSSFPLIPQLTQGFELDNLRQLLEAKEKEGLNVRASYQSGNKVGASNNPVKVWNDDGTYNKEAKINETNSLQLDRKGWGIQQDVPFKSDKAQEDKVRLGTQLMKLMFGDGIMDADGFEFEGKKMTGLKMHQLYEQLFGELLDSKRDKFNKKLKLNKNGEIENSYQTAKKLQRLLKSEAESRGYPLNDIVGLGLDKDGNFNLPLWASNNVNRYEALMNSVVTNALIKIKFPGYSYVAGSNEGFKSPIIKEEGNYQNSEVIYTKHWNGDKLQMTHTADGKLQKAQVLLPSKFKNKDGKLIDLFSKSSGEYIYVTKENNQWKLKDGMVEDDLLNLLSFRIPTSSIGSAANIEIAGFLPFTSGDLIIVPSEFTKQKGMDFDVDKEYTYHYWHTIGEDGKIKKVDSLYQKETPDEVLADMNELRASMLKELNKHSYAQKELAKIDDENSTLEEQGLEGFEETNNKAKDLKRNILANPETYLENLKAVNQSIADLESHKEKIVQNKIIGLMQAVMANPSDEVQAKINNALSIDYAKQQAEELASLSPKDNNRFTGLSDMYQKEQFLNGVSGKIGTGAYSLDVVFHSLTQQAAMQGNPLSVTEVVSEDGYKTVQPKVWNFGNIQLNTEYGKQKTVDGDRTITQVNSEQQNIAVDNGKEKVMGKVNINAITMDVDKMFNLLGADKGDDGTKLSYVFLSQPIIKDYVKAMQNSKSVMADFRADREQSVIFGLLYMYNKEGATEVIDDEYWKKYESQLDSSILKSELSKQTPNGALQQAVLLRFLDMKNYGIATRGIQGAINTDSKGLNKSFFNVIEKLNTLDNLGNLGDIKNASKLVGDYIKRDEAGDDTTMKNLGYQLLPTGKYWIKPTTISGKIGINSLMTAYTLYKNFLPYDSNRFNQIYNEILPEIQGDEPSESRNVELKQEILREMKKFLAVKNGNGLFHEEDLAESRKSLYIDSKENTSLASYLKELMNTTGNPIIEKFIKQNSLLKRMEFDIKIDGTPSKIIYNNAVGEDFDEQELFNSFAYLMSYSRELPKIGNKQYTTSTLAQAMVEYAHLGNAIQEAIQFIKFIPSEYYNQVGYTQFMKNLHIDLVNDIEDTNVFGFGSDENSISSFAIQFAQHKPSRIKYKLSNNTAELNKMIGDTNPEYKGKIENLTNFQLLNDDSPKFITIYNSDLKSNEKQQLYVKYNNQYIRIPILGTFGMDEYSPEKKVGTSIINEQVPLRILPVKAKMVQEITPENDTYKLASNDIHTIIKAIGDNNETAIGKIAKTITDYLNPNTKITFADINADGEYHRNTDSIVISNALLQEGNQFKIAKTIVHEVIHSLTANQITQYITENPNRLGTYSVKANAPEYVSNLIQLYNVTRNTIGEDKINAIRDSLRKDGFLSSEEREVGYGGTSIYEFISLSLTEPSFQQALKDTPYKASDSTLWDKFMNVINDMLKSLGITFNKDGITANAIRESFELITNENKPKSNISSFNNDVLFQLNSLGDNDFNETQELDFPTKELDIKDEKCK